MVVFIAYMKLNFTVCLHIMNQDQINAASTELLLSVGLLARRARAASSSHELSWTQRAVMGRLAKEGPATISDLARAESMKPQSMGTTVAALQEMGFSLSNIVVWGESLGTGPAVQLAVALGVRRTGLVTLPARMQDVHTCSR